MQVSGDTEGLGGAEIHLMPSALMPETKPCPGRSSRATFRALPTQPSEPRATETQEPETLAHPNTLALSTHTIPNVHSTVTECLLHAKHFSRALGTSQ